MVYRLTLVLMCFDDRKTIYVLLVIFDPFLKKKKKPPTTDMVIFDFLQKKKKKQILNRATRSTDLCISHEPPPTMNTRTFFLDNKLQAKMWTVSGATKNLEQIIKKKRLRANSE